eukprot:2273514-Amphidinium_carterae.1
MDELQRWHERAQSNDQRHCKPQWGAVRWLAARGSVGLRTLYNHKRAANLNFFRVCPGQLS